MSKVLLRLSGVAAGASALALALAPASVHAGGRSDRTLGVPSAKAVTLILVLDRSGSMSGAKLVGTRKAAVRMIRWLRPTDQVGVLAFDTQARILSKLGRVGKGRAHLAAVKRLQAGGGTSFGPALKAALKMLKRAPANHRRHVIFLSDGQSSRQGVLSALSALVHAGATLSTIALGTGADRAYLRKMARAGKGRAYATTSIGLAAVCRKELGHLGR
jgi:Ca-activated chloride channel homolog